MRHDGITYRDEHGYARPLLPNSVLPHPFLQRNKRFLPRGHSDLRYRYRFLRITRVPDGARPYGGRILVENLASRERREFYAHLFDINWRRMGPMDR